MEYEDVIKDFKTILSDDDYLSKCSDLKLMNLHEQNIKMEENVDIAYKVSPYKFTETINNYEVYVKIRTEIMKRLRDCKDKEE